MGDGVHLGIDFPHMLRVDLAPEAFAAVKELPHYADLLAHILNAVIERIPVIGTPERLLLQQLLRVVNYIIDLCDCIAAQHTEHITLNNPQAAT